MIAIVSPAGTKLKDITRKAKHPIDKMELSVEKMPSNLSGKRINIKVAATIILQDKPDANFRASLVCLIFPAP